MSSALHIHTHTYTYPHKQQRRYTAVNKKKKKKPLNICVFEVLFKWNKRFLSLDNFFINCLIKCNSYLWHDAVGVDSLDK